ncbi:uncharacterized protein LOC114582354 isoform X2 [Podarcis muralis]
MPPSQVPPSCPILGLEWLGARCLLMSPFVLQRGEGSAWEPLHHGRDWSPDKGLSPQRAVDWENLQQPSGAGKPSEIRRYAVTFCGRGSVSLSSYQLQLLRKEGRCSGCGARNHWKSWS